MTPNPQDSAVALEVERAAFEAWAGSLDSWLPNIKRSGDRYVSAVTAAAWHAWQKRASQSDGTSGVLTDAEVEDLYVLACSEWGEVTGECPSVGVFLAKHIFAALAAKTKTQGATHGE